MKLRRKLIFFVSEQGVSEALNTDSACRVVLHNLVVSICRTLPGTSSLAATSGANTVVVGPELTDRLVPEQVSEDNADKSGAFKLMYVVFQEKVN